MNRYPQYPGHQRDAFKQNPKRLAVLIGFVCLAMVGCQNEIDNRYGNSNGASVSGTSVLADMIEQKGHTVFSWGRLSPKLHDRADCIVWFPDDFEPPSEEVRQWFDEWLKERPKRTLIYVGRDFDTKSFYWKKVIPLVPVDQKKEAKKRLRNAKTDFRSARNGNTNNVWQPTSTIPASEDCEWFTVNGTYSPRQVTTLSGSPQWTQGIDAKKLEIELISRIEPSPFAQILLESEGDMLVSVEPWYSSKTIVIANGAFLLNMPLVNHEHRKLASRLIDEIGPPKQTVVFLETSAGGPRIYLEEPRASLPNGIKIFHLWPTNWILLQLCVVGLLVCFWRWPIFGRPRDLEATRVADFGLHLEALAKLFGRTENTQYAQSRIAHYRQMIRPTSKRKPNPSTTKPET